MSTTTPNMSLTLPAVGTEAGPAYAQEINNDMSTIDQHNHTAGNGVPVPSAGLNINTDLSFGNNNLTLARSLRLNPQGSPLALGTDLGCLYESGVDLYYNDGNGNQIRMTQSGSIAGATGSISGLVSPASATYNAGSATFTWQSDSNVAANMDFRSATLRNSSVSSNGITLAAPVSLPGNYSITLPSSLPAAQHFVSLDNSGNLAANWVVDNSTIEISSNTVRVKAKGITASQIADGTITGTQIQTNVSLNGLPTVNIGAGNFALMGAAGENNLYILRGTVSSAGSTTAGAGFTSATGGSPTRLTVTFTIPFASTPSVTATPLISGANVVGVVALGNITVNGFDCYATVAPSTSFSSTAAAGISFIAIGTLV